MNSFYTFFFIYYDYNKPLFEKNKHLNNQGNAEAFDCCDNIYDLKSVSVSGEQSCLIH